MKLGLSRMGGGMGLGFKGGGSGAQPGNLGPEIIVNGGFDDGTGWTLGANTSIAGGKLVGAAVSGGVNMATNSASAVAARTYRTVYTVDSISGGTVRLTIGTTNGQGVTLPGTYEQDIVAGVSPSIRLVQVVGTLDVVIDNLSVREIL